MIGDSFSHQSEVDRKLLSTDKKNSSYTTLQKGFKLCNMLTKYYISTLHTVSFVSENQSDFHHIR